MSIAITIDLPVDPERTDEFLALVKQTAPDTRAYDGCEQFDIYTDQDRPGRILFYERWASRAQQETYLAWRTETGLLETVTAFLVGEPTFSYFDPFDG